MKDLITDANFPRTADQRVYHLGIKAGEVANRLITVGSPSRAECIASFLDTTPTPFRLSSERGFTTITGRFKGYPISIVSIGMGSANADFFMREVRECLTGDMIVVRLGSCGALIETEVGSVIVPEASIAVTRNYDFDFATGQSDQAPYRLSKPVPADLELSSTVRDILQATRPFNSNLAVIAHTLNASADSFYSSQGRQTSFPDHNEDIIATLKNSYENLATLEMETFHILHLAASWSSKPLRHEAPESPLSRRPVSPFIAQAQLASRQLPPRDLMVSGKDCAKLNPRPRIRAAAAQMVFAVRGSQEFITPEKVRMVENWCAHAILEALTAIKIEPQRLHADTGSVWEMRN